MAFLIKRKKSVYWWISYKDSRGERVRESTHFRRDDPLDTKKARILAHQKTGPEIASAPMNQHDRWDFWVPAFLARRYKNRPATFGRYCAAWKNLAVYFQMQKIACPIQLKYEAVTKYITFRERPPLDSNVRKGGHNTILLELKVLNLAMNEAVRMGYAIANPAIKLGIARKEPKEKPAISDEDARHIFKSLNSDPCAPEWMAISFEIAYYTGARLRETSIAMTLVNLAEKRITLHGKGGKVFEIPIREELIPLLTKLKSEGRKFTCEIPQTASRDWTRFFKKIRVPQYCFHCLRVTFITKAARAGVQERDVMRLVNHASTIIHRIYQRLRAADLVAPLAAIPIRGLH